MRRYEKTQLCCPCSRLAALHGAPQTHMQLLPDVADRLSEFWVGGCATSPCYACWLIMGKDAIWHSFHLPIARIIYVDIYCFIGIMCNVYPAYLHTYSYRCIYLWLYRFYVAYM